MNKYIKLGKDNYIVSKSTGDIIERCDPNDDNVELHIALPESTLIVDGKQIHQEYGGNIVVNYNDDRYIIDDGYSNNLVKAGYIVRDDYDNRHESDSTLGKIIRSEIVEDIREVLEPISRKYNSEGTCIPSTMFCDRLETRMMIGGEDDHYKYTVKFNTVNNIVNKNNIRKANSLPFYPYEKKMDRYGTIYCSIFAQKNYSKTNDPDKYSTPDTIIRDVVSALGAHYHYVPMEVGKRRVVYWNGI